MRVYSLAPSPGDVVRLIAQGGLASHHETRGQCHVRLTLADRSEIENGLRSNRGFSAIARTLKKAGSTVMREILSHRVPSDNGAKARVANRCIKRCKCDRKYLCSQDGQANCVPKGATLHNLTQRLPLGRMAREKAYGMECTALRK